MTLKTRGTFNPGQEKTRLNSKLTKRRAIEHLYYKGHSNIALITCPGPARYEEDREHLEIIRDFPGLQLTVFYYEGNPKIAEEMDISCGDMFQELAILHNKGTLRVFDALIVEWDQTHSHQYNLQYGAPTNPSKGIWWYAMSVLKSLRMPIVFTYTHSTRPGRGGSKNIPYRYENPISQDIEFGRNKPHWATYLTRLLRLTLERQPTLIFSSRNYWKWVKETHSYTSSKRGSTCWRWVWYIN